MRSMFLWLIAAPKTTVHPAAREARKTPAFSIASKTLPPNYAAQPPRNYGAKLMARGDP